MAKKMTFAWIEIAHNMCVDFYSKPHGGHCECNGNRSNKKPALRIFRFRKRILVGSRLNRSSPMITMPGSWSGKSTGLTEPRSSRCIAAVVRGLTIRWQC